MATGFAFESTGFDTALLLTEGFLCFGESFRWSDRAVLTFNLSPQEQSGEAWGVILKWIEWSSLLGSAGLFV